MTMMMSTARRRELGAELRGIREGVGFNGNEMAARMHWAASTLSRAESGKRPMTPIEVATYLGLCGVAGDRQRELLALLDEPDEYRVKAHPDHVPDALRALLLHESTACAIETFEPIYIPGILQTAEYAKALFEETGLVDPADIGRWVDIRLGRREVLTRVNPAQCTMLIHENALRAMVGGPEVMVEQMLHLLFVGDRPQCDIRVVPASAGGRGLVASSFHIFRYTEDPPLVHVQNETTSEFLENDQEIRGYRSVLNRVAKVALDDAHSREWISRVASEFDQGVAPDEAGLAQE